MERPPYKFNLGDRVIIGKTTWPNKKKKAMEGQVGIVNDRTYYSGYGNGNHYLLTDGYWFEEDCLTLAEEETTIEEITTNEVEDILRG